MSEAVISVIIPVFNREAEIGRCLLSLLNQSFPCFEGIVINDCSTDDTARVIESFDDPRIRAIHLTSNSGQCAARNIGIHAASCRLLSFLDSDDELLPDKLGFVYRYFVDRPDVDVLIDSFECVLPTLRGSVLRVHRNPELHHSAEIQTAVYGRLLWKATGAISARRDALMKAGLWDESLKRRTDMDLVLRLARSTRCASTAAILWRKHCSAQAISAERETFISALIEIVRRHPAYTSKHQWRTGLAIDISSHLIALVAHLQFSLALRDCHQLRQFLGTQATLYYVGLGSAILMWRTLYRW